MTQKVQHSDSKKVSVNGIEIVYDTFGEPSASPMLLVHGLGAQMIAWDDDFCAGLASQGFWVIRFDNRDVGLSTKFEKAGVPNIPALLRAGLEGEAIQSPFFLHDMADDSVGLLDTLGVDSAHVVGVSMGGMIAQEITLHHSDRVRTLTSIMSSTGNPELPPPTPQALMVLLEPAPPDRAAYIERSVKASQVLHGTEMPFDVGRVRERAGRFFDRGLCPTGTARQMAAIIASGSRKEALKSISVPTLVIHGDADPLVPVEGGIDTANAISGSELLIINGLGHALPPPVWTQVIEAITRHAI
jgi:pimeloyl-ACP methyl ester carboxylesterase